MTEHGERKVRVAELKARLSEYLRAARKGQAVTVCDRETPVARLVPINPTTGALGVRLPVHGLHAVPLPPPLRKAVNSLAALLEERQGPR